MAAVYQPQLAFEPASGCLTQATGLHQEDVLSSW